MNNLFSKNVNETINSPSSHKFCKTNLLFLQNKFFWLFVYANCSFVLAKLTCELFISSNFYLNLKKKTISLSQISLPWYRESNFYLEFCACWQATRQYDRCKGSIEIRREIETDERLYKQLIFFILRWKYW